MRYAVRSAVVLCALGCSVGTLRADTNSATLTIEKTTIVPGGSLKPGVYTIGIVDSLQDRMVVHVDGDSGKTHLLFLAVPKSAGDSGVHSVEWDSSTSGKRALRGFNFGSQYVEFVYPKKDAVAIANANGASVVAIDPASEGRPELKKLTSQDREMVSLWMLSPVQVGPQKGISAKHYTPAPQVEAAAPQQSNPSPSVTVSQTGQSKASSAPVTSNTMQVAKLHTPPAPKPYRPSIKRLPQTGSDMPLVWLIGGASLLGAITLRTRRAFTI